MNRLTEHEAGGYASSAAPEALLARLGRYEDCHEALTDELERCRHKLEELSAGGKGRSATYKQLLSNKLLLQELLDRLARYVKED